MNQSLEIEVFRAGDYGPKGVWDEAALDQLAADYDPALLEAPVTLDHAQSGPALGWVGALRRVGDRLVASLRGLNLKLLDLIHKGSFKKRSVELYPRLRETGGPYLRAVSFLGAAVPEVKGLADPLPAAEAAPVFNDDAGAYVQFNDDLSDSPAMPDQQDVSEMADSSDLSNQSAPVPVLAFSDVVADSRGRRGSATWAGFC